MLRVLICTGLWFSLISAGGSAQAADPPLPQPTRMVVYKILGDVRLQLHIFEPEEHQASDQRPAVVFFFGGGWVAGTPQQFSRQAAHLADRGMVACCAEYRIRNRHGTTPFECVKDGKSAIRFLRIHAKEMGIDPGKIVAAGGSAGGHIAAATATVTGLDEEGEDKSVSAVPNALVLFNPVYDNGPNGYGYDRIQDRYKEISPLHNIRKGMPPTLVFLGTKDKLIPVETAQSFQDKMKAVGSRSELMLFEGAPHGFFNRGEHFERTLQAMDTFLVSLGYLPAQEKP